MQYQFRKATHDDIPVIWEIIEAAIKRRAAEGSNQWQNGYPNKEIIVHDIDCEHGFVLLNENEIAAYVAVLINDEPAYDNIEGKWLTTGDFVVFHRVAVASQHLGKGLTKILMDYIETFARANNIFSVKADTNFDNVPMLRTFEKLGYTYCGEVYFRGSARKAFEKVLVP